MDTQVIGLAAAYIIFEIVKFLVNKLGPKPIMGLTVTQAQQLKEVHVLNIKTDDDGRPSIYVPKELLISQEKIIEALRDISYTQRETVKVLERLVTKLEEKDI